MLRTLGAGLRAVIAAPLFVFYTIWQSARARLILAIDSKRGQDRTDQVARNWTKRFLRIPPITLTVEGLDNIEPGEQYIIVSNHLSNFDIPVTVQALSPLRTRFISKQEIAKVPLFGKAAEGVGVVMIDRAAIRSNHEELNAAIKQSLDNGNSILVFAEGTRSRTGEMQDFRRGAARIALATGVDILPIVINGTYQINPPGSPLVYPGEATVRVLPPISIEDYSAQDVPRLTDELRKLIGEHFDELRAAADHQS